MKRIIRSVFFSLGFIVSGLSVSAQANVAPEANTLLWRVSGNGLSKPSYIFGTIHSICKADAEKVLTPTLKQAMQACNEVMFEIDINNTAAMIVATLSNSTMANGTNLKQLVNKKQLKIITDYFTTEISKYPLERVMILRPFLLQGDVSKNFLTCTEKTDMEGELNKIADSYNLPVSGISSVKEQASFSDSIPYKKQAESLLETIRRVKNPEANRDFFDIMNFYANQQMISLDSIIRATMGRGKEDKVMLDTRNKLWIARIQEKMKTKQIFLAVGVAHLFGAEGIIPALRREGYTIEGVLNN